MSSIGRGRGWGKNPPENPGALRRPGKPLQPNQLSNFEEIDEWIQKIEELDINDSCGIDSSVSSIFDAIKLSYDTPTDEEINGRFEKIVNKALEDRVFAAKFVFAAKNNFVSRLLTYLQTHFEDREKMIKENLPRFINLAYVLSEFYHQVRIVQKTPLKALEVPVVMCYEMLLGLAGEEEIELAATQISLNGRMLHLRSVQSFPKLMIITREILATRNLSSRSRVMLMLIIDLYHKEFMPLSGELQTFYTEHLGQETLLLMQSNLKNIWIIIDTQSKREADMENEIIEGILMRHPSSQKSQPKKHSPKNFSAQNNSDKSNNSGPRAIRGSGAVKNKDFRGDKKFPEKKDKNNDSTWSNWNDGNNKSWNHDDRFSKDY